MIHALLTLACLLAQPRTVDTRTGRTLTEALKVELEEPSYLTNTFFQHLRGSVVSVELQVLVDQEEQSFVLLRGHPVRLDRPTLLANRITAGILLLLTPRQVGVARALMTPPSECTMGNGVFFRILK